MRSLFYFAFIVVFIVAVISNVSRKWAIQDVVDDTVVYYSSLSFEECWEDENALLNALNGIGGSLSEPDRVAERLDGKCKQGGRLFIRLPENAEIRKLRRRCDEKGLEWHDLQGRNSHELAEELRNLVDNEDSN